MDAQALITKLVDHELHMAQLYRAMARRLPERAETLLQLAVEEEGHADMLRHIRDTFIPDGLVTEEDIQASAVRVDQAERLVERLTVQVDAGSFEERTLIDEILRLECGNAELEINRVVMEHRERPAFKIFAEILDAEEAHEKILREW